MAAILSWSLYSSQLCEILNLVLTHWGRVTHICVGKLTIIGSDNGLSPGRRQAIIWTNAGILLIGPLGTNFSEILNKIQTFSLKKIRLKMSSAKCCPFRLGLNVLTHLPLDKMAASLAMAWHRTGDKPLSEPMMIQLIAELGGDELMKWVVIDVNAELDLKLCPTVQDR